MRPTRSDPPCCTYAELLDGTYGINHLADFHELLDEEEEYRRRFEEASKK